MSDSQRVSRASSVSWVHVSEIRTSKHAQREFRPHMAEKIAVNFDPDKLGVPVVNLRDGRYWVIDGQHRVEGLRLMGYDDQLIECQVYEGLDEKQEAEMFLGLNTRLSMGALDRFLVALTAQRDRELSIARAVEAEGLKIGKGKGGIFAVTALGKTHDLAGWERLREALRILRDSYGDAGMRAELIEGVGMVCHRYNGLLKEDVAVEKLGALRGGVGGLISRAELLRRQVGRPRAHCVAAAVVETINAGRGGKKLPDWWT